MGDRVSIRPTDVASTGGRVKSDSQEARRALVGLFDSAKPAADGNSGFATGPSLLRFVTGLRGEFNSTINELDTTATKIVDAARTVASTDAETAEGLSRIVSSLNGLRDSQIGGPPHSPR